MMTAMNGMDWNGKVVLITGGTGSFGQAFTRYLLDNEPVSQVVIFSRDEFKQFDMQHRFRDARVRYVIGDVRDADRLRRAFGGVDLVVHAAALKQVPACEYNPPEAVKTNIIGAMNVIDAAIESGVQRVMALSTDKAANPVNLYGATKLCQEKLIVQGNGYAGPHVTRFACVRYGNVIASRGSLVPLLYEQGAKGRVTLTDPRMTRFWVTIGDAVRFVKRSIEEMRGGEIFVPKMPSVKILDLIAAIAPNAGIEEIGIRPGEKIHEILVTFDESRHTVDRGGSFVVEPEHPWWRAGDGERPRTGAEFVYSSDRNEHFLTVAEITERLPQAIREISYEASSATMAPAPS